MLNITVINCSVWNEIEIKHKVKCVLAFIVFILYTELTIKINININNCHCHLFCTIHLFRSASNHWEAWNSLQVISLTMPCALKKEKTLEGQ